MLSELSETSGRRQCLWVDTPDSPVRGARRRQAPGARPARPGELRRYHLGYAGFQGPALGWVVVRNAIITSSYLLTGSPLATILSHVAMHVAAVLHGIKTTLQLQPHY